jgi:hypothetical protein
MSFNIVSQAANDPNLQIRIQAAAYGEAINNPVLAATAFGAQVRLGYANMTGLHWAVGQTVQAEYEGGVLAGRGTPGHDPDVVTDGQITSAVVANWPPDPTP